MTVNGFADVVNLVGVVTRHRNNVLIGKDVRFGEEIGVVEVDTESRDADLDAYWADPTDIVSCQRVRMADAGYRYRVFCPLWCADFLFRALMEEE